MEQLIKKMDEEFGDLGEDLKRFLRENIVKSCVPPRKEEKGLNLSPEKSWFQGFNACLDKVIQLNKEGGDGT